MPGASGGSSSSACSASTAGLGEVRGGGLGRAVVEQALAELGAQLAEPGRAGGDQHVGVAVVRPQRARGRRPRPWRSRAPGAGSPARAASARGRRAPRRGCAGCRPAGALGGRTGSRRLAASTASSIAASTRRESSSIRACRARPAARCRSSSAASKAALAERTSAIASAAREADSARGSSSSVVSPSTARSISFSTPACRSRRLVGGGLGGDRFADEREAGDAQPAHEQLGAERVGPGAAEGGRGRRSSASAAGSAAT